MISDINNIYNFSQRTSQVFSENQSEISDSQNHQIEFHPDRDTNQELALQSQTSKTPEWLNSDSNVDVNIVASFLEINHGNLDAATFKKVRK